MMAWGFFEVESFLPSGSFTMEAGSLLRRPRSIRRVPAVPVKVQPIGPAVDHDHSIGIAIDHAVLSGGIQGGMISTGSVSSVPRHH